MATYKMTHSREEELKTCQRRLEYLSSRLQDLAIEIGDGQGAVWLKQNMWFLNKPALFFDDVLYSVGKICNHLVSYLTFHKQKLASNFPFLSYMGILYEVGEILGIVRDMLLVNPSESLSVKQSQIDLFWTDCTPFLFIFENSNYLLLSSKQIPLYMRALLDLVPAVIQVGMCMYCSPESQLRGFDCFAETCIRLSKALVEPGEFLSMAEQLEPIIVPFLRQWILFALELVQNGVKVRTDMTFLSPRVSARLDEAKREFRQTISNEDSDATVPKTLNVLSLSSDSSLPDEVAESSLAPLKIRNSCLVRAACQPYKWIDVANTRLANCPNEQRKGYLEEIGLRENQKLISDIFIMYGKTPNSWKGIKVHCPLTKRYDEVKVKLFIKVKVGEQWEERDAQYDRNFGKGDFLVFEGCKLDGFVAIEERPLTKKQIGPEGGKLSTPYDPNMEATIPKGTRSKASLVKMMVQPTDKPAERQYRAACPEDFKHIKATSHAIELDGISMEEKNISIKIPFTVLNDPNTKILVLKYTSDNIEVNDSEGMLEETGENIFTVSSGNGGTVLATVDRTYSTGTEALVRKEMEVLLGKKQLCKLLIFVENQNAQHEAQADLNQIVLSVVCAEKYRLSDVIKDKAKIGLIELPKSQSPDRLLKQADDIKLEIKGSVSLDPDIPEDAYTLTYLEGSDNYVRFPVKVADFNGKITFVLRLGRDNSVLHTYFCSVQDILALIVQGYIAPTPPASPGTEDDVFSSYQVSEKTKEEPQPEKETEVIKDKLSFTPSLMRETSSSSVSLDENEPTEPDKEASLKILNRNSLVNLAKYVISDEGSLLGVCLGLKPEKISQIYRMYRHSSSLASFYVLYEWRGRKTQADLADKLIQALFDIGRRDLANIVSDVRKQNRGLSSEDFAHLNTRQRTRRS
ncbi:uncharacterized protein LOC123553966 isoform X2 [Mercenaria mercenaria]|uniref:uncharacterized protein LOC123553966 isoform X2 n=1 Tax=Mercenaria mercenaria TaxID=6596 RepID=UPI00234FA5F8|nr:uncharacterized protein LOC123553966 isoform X2 [Mercenaria mercenaria]